MFKLIETTDTCTLTNVFATAEEAFAVKARKEQVAREMGLKVSYSVFKA